MMYVPLSRLDLGRTTVASYYPTTAITPPSASRHLTNDRALSSGANASKMINMSLGIINE